MEGTFRARLVEHQFGQSGTGSRQITGLFEITQKGPFEGQRLFWYGNLKTVKSAEITARAMAAAGYDGESLGTFGRRPVMLLVKEEEYNGKTRPRVKGVYEVDRPLSVKPIAGGEVSEMERKLAALCKAKQIGAVVPVEPEPEYDEEGVAYEGDGDGIPF